MDTNGLESAVEVWILKTKNLAFSIIQITGFAVVFAGIYRMFTPQLLHGAIGIPNVQAVTQHIPMMTPTQGIFTIVAGLIVVWVSTSSSVY